MAMSKEMAAQWNMSDYCVQLDMIPTQTLHKLHATEKYNSLLRSLVFKWHKRMDRGAVGKCQKTKGSGRSADTNSVGCH